MRRRRDWRPERELLEDRLAPATGAWSAAIGADSVSSSASAETQQLPLGLQYAASAALGAGEASYAVSATGTGGYSLSNGANSYTAYVDAGGFQVAGAGSSWSLDVVGIGYGDNQTSLGAATTVASSNRVEYDYGAISQWFVNGPLGLQQGFTLDARPAGGASSGLLTIDLALGGDYKAAASSDGTSVTLASADGSSSMVYGGLIAYDATGATVPARMVVTTSTDGRQEVSIVVDDAKAQYPLTIDPFVQQSKVNPSVGGTAVYFGNAVSLSADGKTAAIGARSSSVASVPGAVYIFSSNGASWGETSRLTVDSSPPADDFGFGYSVALSADGSTLVVGQPDATVGNVQKGAAYVFTLSGSTWSQAAKVTSSDGAAGDMFGFSVSANASGSVFVVGTPYADSAGKTDLGAVYYFGKSGSTWTQASKLTQSTLSASSYYGYAVALSASGTTLAVGAPNANVGTNTTQGLVYAYYNGVIKVLTASDAAADSGLGAAVALNDDGSTLLVGAPLVDVGGNANQGAAYVFFRSLSNWTQIAKITASDGQAGDEFGLDVSLSPDGRRAAVGAAQAAVGSNSHQGVVYVFDHLSGVTWTQTARLTASDGAASDHLGQGVAVSATTVLAGAPLATVNPLQPYQGAAYFFYEAPVLQVTANPTSRTATVGQSTTFTASSTAALNLGAQWQVSTDGSNWSNISGATNAWYTLVPTMADSGKQYRVVFSDGSGGTATSTAATLTVVKAVTKLTIATSAQPRRIGDPLTITVTAASASGVGSPNGGTVTLNFGGNNLSQPLTNGQAVFSNIPTLALGTYVVTATYDGTNDANFASAITTTSQVVVRGTSAITASVPAQSTVGQAVTLTVTLAAVGNISNMEGGVVVLDTGVPIAFPQFSTQNGVTTASYTTSALTAGSHWFQFVFLGNPELFAASSTVYQLVVNAAGATSSASISKTTTTPAGSGATTSGTNQSAAATTTNAYVGVPLTLTASLPTAIVGSGVQWQLSSDGTNWADIYNANQTWYTFTPTLNLSGYQYRAVFTNYTGGYSITTPTTLSVAKALPVLTVSTSVNPRAIGGALKITVNAASSMAGLPVPNGGKVSINIGTVNYSGTMVNGLAVFNNIPPVPLGTYVVTATYDGTNDPYFGSATATTKQVVVRGASALTASVPTSATLGQSVTLTATLTATGNISNNAGGVMILDNGIPIAFPQLTTSNGVTTATYTTSTLSAMTHQFQFVFLGNPELYAASSGVYTLNVTPAQSATASIAVKTSTIAPTTGTSSSTSINSLAMAEAFASTATTRKVGRSSSALGFWAAGSN
ncbi:beta strand repeat-containing protein [Paludisphaera rhizosphaerae]|uniref:beta strand repeat-containing protein n=1 Tax=Paludisphaera rhizosphaerae TaxID=2711216 RepID=UPI0013EE343C|nr:Ig-like domain repeat protein [Paludisphaera rhizosphaerae]